MKKTLISLSALMMALPVMAANDCAYSPLQNLIRNVRSVNEINELIQRGVVFDEEVRCGGSLMQLAVLRGNPEVLQAILKQDPSRANALVKLDSYAIPGSVREVPLILFAAFYAPNDQMIYRLVESGADISKTDSAGRNLLWYMDQNPVLRNTALYDKLNNLLLSSLVPSKTRQAQQLLAPSQTMPGNAPREIIPQSLQPETVNKGPSVVEAND